MKVVFLDFDGVVTAKRETPGSYMTHGPDGYGPTPACLRRVLRLAGRTGARIVVSSNWRKFDADGPGSVWRNPVYGDVRNPLPGLLPALGRAYLETLPPVRGIRKAPLVRYWLAGRGDVDGFVALDDMCEEEGFGADPLFEGRYVNTDPETGLTDADCEKAEKILASVKYDRREL